jgi:hypothetical protein
MRTTAFQTIPFALACCGNLLAQTGNANYNLGAETGRVVGKPYSATQVTHSVQNLANGSHIDRTTTNLVWQDDQGRVRMETTDERRRIVIQDMVAMVVYNIDREHRTARKNEMRLVGAVAAQKIAGDVSPVEEARAMARKNPNHLVEDLGSQFISGVSALGVRVTTTIPIGAIGNDQELKSVTERWYSNDIHAMVKTVTTDPRTGIYTYELTNIVRSAPDPALFQVPAGFTVTTVENGPLPTAAKKQ